MDAASKAERIDAVLPQTQCRQCGYADCHAYAAAIADGATGIDRCPPGGDVTIASLAALTGRPVVPLDTTCGAPLPLQVACIDEAACIGCTLCIAACPLDAILGGPKRMHVVLASLCSGCALCVAPCPVDCITIDAADRTWTKGDADAARARHDARRGRLAAIAERSVQRIARERRQASVAAAMARARARRQANPA